MKTSCKGLIVVAALLARAALAQCVLTGPTSSADNRARINSALAVCTTVSLGDGLWQIDGPIEVPDNRTIQSVNPQGATLQADPSVFPTCGPDDACARGLLQRTSPCGSGGAARFTSLILDGNGVAVYGVVGGCPFTLSRSTVRRGYCAGVGIVGPGIGLDANTIENNGSTNGGMACHPRRENHGAGIYVSTALLDNTPQALSPMITGNTIRNNVGLGLDVNAAWGGTFRGNTVSGNSGYAGLNLYAASNWTIDDNTVEHPLRNFMQPLDSYHPACARGPHVPYTSAAVLVCEDTDVLNQVATGNWITNNRISGWYGILLTGNDANEDLSPGRHSAVYVTPRFNTISGNDVTGSIVGCADDARESVQQGYSGNAWYQNNCGGSPNTGPAQF